MGYAKDLWSGRRTAGGGEVWTNNMPRPDPKIYSFGGRAPPSWAGYEEIERTDWCVWFRKNGHTKTCIPLGDVLAYERTVG